VLDGVFFGLGTGWYRWALWLVDSFNGVGGPSVAMNRGMWCAGTDPKPVPWNDSAVSRR